MSKHILITGGTGLVGKKLTEILKGNHHEVAHLSRNPKHSTIRSFYWDPEHNEIDPGAIDFADIIVHLAGENISKGRWTKEQKKKIVDSRVNTSNLLYQTTKAKNKTLEAFISASAIGYYGSYTSETIFHEGMPAGEDFLAKTVKQWEDAVTQFETLKTRTVKLRIGVVLSKHGGALPKLIKTVGIGAGSGLGSGKQYMPWIAIDDLSALVFFAIQNETLSGTYNAVAPEHITNRAFMKSLARTLKKPFFLPNIPSVFIKLLFGEMSMILLEGSRVSCEKIQKAGFVFTYPDLKSALIKATDI